MLPLLCGVIIPDVVSERKLKDEFGRERRPPFSLIAAGITGGGSMSTSCDMMRDWRREGCGDGSDAGIGFGGALVEPLRLSFLGVGAELRTMGARRPWRRDAGISLGTPEDMAVGDRDGPRQGEKEEEEEEELVCGCSARCACRSRERHYRSIGSRATGGDASCWAREVRTRISGEAGKYAGRCRYAMDDGLEGGDGRDAGGHRVIEWLSDDSQRRFRRIAGAGPGALGGVW